MPIDKHPPNFGEAAYAERKRYDQAAIPDEIERVPEPNYANEKIMANQKAKVKSLNGIILDRRDHHSARVHAAFSELTTALCEAEEDGFQFFMYSNAPQPASLNSTISQAVETRIPRLYDVDVVPRYSAPI